MVTRCSWVTNDPLYIEYHDEEWGKPEYDPQKLFELLCLEGQQAGLSWITVLKKRQHYRQHFFNFEAQKIVDHFDPDALMQESGLIRHRAKLEAIYLNAKAYLQMQQDNVDFSQFIWSFVDGKPQKNDFNDLKEAPSKTEISTIMSKELKKKGFKFVGPVTCYAFMQAAGLVNDHLLSCFKR